MYCKTTHKVLKIKCISENNEAKWEYTDIDCNPGPEYQCLPPLSTSGITYSPQKSVYNLQESVSFNCSNGGELIGRKMLSCVLQNFSSHPMSTFYGNPPTCLMKQCTALLASDELNVIQRSGSQNFPFAPGSMYEFKCKNETEYELDCGGHSPCIANCSWELSWNITQLPTCVRKLCYVKGNDEVEPDKFRASYGEPIHFSCRQPNYILSGNF